MAELAGVDIGTGRCETLARNQRKRSFANECRHMEKQDRRSLTRFMGNA